MNGSGTARTALSPNITEHRPADRGKLLLNHLCQYVWWRRWKGWCQTPSARHFSSSSARRLKAVDPRGPDGGGGARGSDGRSVTAAREFAEIWGEQMPGTRHLRVVTGRCVAGDPGPGDYGGPPRVGAGV